jgi:hypothetical protein
MGIGNGLRLMRWHGVSILANVILSMLWSPLCNKAIATWKVKWDLMRFFDKLLLAEGKI